MAELNKAKFPIPLSLSNEVLELKESKGTGSSADSEENSTMIHPTNSSAISKNFSVTDKGKVINSQPLLMISYSF